MKKITTLVAVGMTIFSTLTAEAAFVLQVDGRKQKVEITDGKSQNMRIERAGYIKDPELRKTFYWVTHKYSGWQAATAAAGCWQTCDLTFTAKTTGKILLVFRGSSTKDTAWYLVNKMEVNGAIVNNSDFKIPATNQGKSCPKGVYLPGEAVYLPTGGPNSTPAIKVNYLNFGAMQLPVEAGKTYNLKIYFKIMEKEQK